MNEEDNMKYLKYSISLLGCFLLMLLPIHSLKVDAAPEISTSAKGTSLIDVESGRILYSHEGDTEMRIASLTKIMTAIVAIEHGNLSDVVTVSKRAVGKEGSSIYLQLGEKMSLTNLLYGLMLRSGNDAATAIAEHVGGSEAGFVLLMNEKAEQIGLTHTQFRNPHGLDEEGHYSTPNDLAVLTAYALKNRVFAEIVKTKDKQVPNPHEKWNYSWHNKNKMLNMYDGADGVKTGYTKKALRCLVSSATRNKQQLVAVTLNDGDDWRDHKHLLDWGFKHFPLHTLAVKKEKLDGTSYHFAKAFNYPLEESEKENIAARLVEEDKLSINYRLGERGVVQFYLDDKFIGQVPVFESHSSRLDAQAKEKNNDEVFKTFIKESNKDKSILEKIKQIFN